jgi:hypothetical protein
MTWSGLHRGRPRPVRGTRIRSSKGRAQTLSCRWSGRDQDREWAALSVTGEVDFGGQTAPGIGRERESPVCPVGAAPFSAGGGGVLVGADHGGVDLDQPVDVAGRIRLGLDLYAGPA